MAENSSVIRGWMAQHVEHCDINLVVPYAKNARRHSKKQVQQIAASIRRYGFVTPIIVDQTNTIIAGHGRHLAARELGLAVVPVIRISHLTEHERRALRLADNKIALNAEWDNDILVEELKLLVDVDIDEAEVRVDLKEIGFSIPEVSRLGERVVREDAGDPRDDEIPDLDEGEPRCRQGDLWQLGPHRLLCSDARSDHAVGQLMGGELADMVFTDPPHNVRADEISGLGEAKHRELPMVSGEMTQEAFATFLRESFNVLRRFSNDGSIHFIGMDWQHLTEMLDAGSVYTELKDLVVWVKDSGSVERFYRSRHELVFVFKNGRAPHIKTFEPGQHGRYRTNVWENRGTNPRSKTRDKAVVTHPTAKPVGMIADAIRDVSTRGGIVLDLFGGSGSTLIAAQKTGRRGYLCEIDPVCCSRILRRWENFAHDEAVLLDQLS